MANEKIALGAFFILAGIVLLFFGIIGIIYGIVLIVLGLALILLKDSDSKIEERKDKELKTKKH